MVESTALEMRRAGNGTVGSNPTLSAIFPRIATISGGISKADSPSLRLARRFDIPGQLVREYSLIAAKQAGSRAFPTSCCIIAIACSAGMALRYGRSAVSAS